MREKCALSNEGDISVQLNQIKNTEVCDPFTAPVRYKILAFLVFGFLATLSSIFALTECYFSSNSYQSKAGTWPSLDQ